MSHWSGVHGVRPDCQDGAPPWRRVRGGGSLASSNSRLRLRDFFSTTEGWLFAVSGYDNHPLVPSTLRYVPAEDGSRRAGGRRYSKLEHTDALIYVEKNKPEYISGVPTGDVTETYLPPDGLESAARRDRKVAQLAGVLSQLPPGSVGITGSWLLGLETRESDIDLVIYGRRWEEARKLVARSTGEGVLEPVDEGTWREIYDKRRPEISFEEFVLHEERKGNRGMVQDTYFDLLFTRDWGQIVPDVKLESRLCTAIINAEVTCADFAFDSPSILQVDHPDVVAVASYTHTYSGQALPGEFIEARGQIYSSSMGQLLVVGTTREAKGEWVRSISLLEG